MSRQNDIWQRKPAGLVLGLDFSGERVTSPTGHSGTLQGGASISGRTLLLDGSGDYLSFADASEFSFTDGAGTDRPFSICAWVYMNDATNFRAVSKATATSGAAEWFFGTNPSDAMAFAVYSGGSTTNNLSRNSNAAITGLQGQWAHLAGSYDGGEIVSGLLLYVNGVLVASTGSTTGTYAGMSDTSAALHIGALFQASSPSYANGSIADFRLYNRVLAPTEIAQIYHAGAARIALGGTP